MGDSRSSPPATHLYTQHPSAIHSAPYKATLRPGAHAPLFAASLPAPSLHHHHHHHLQPQHPQRPAHGSPATLLYLHSLLSVPVAVPLAVPVAVPVAGSDRLLQPAAAVPARARYPTVIVSPHYQPLSCERDSTHPAAKSRLPTSSRARTQLDGHNATLSGVLRSAPPMTSNAAAAAMGRREDRATPHARTGRPALVSHTSNSVPSTPLQLARQYESRSRSPSPNGGLGSHSPRSVSSEANGPHPTLRAPRLSPCRFENNTAFGKRRFPYKSSELLEPPKEEPKKSLDPQEDEKLSGDMRTLYDRLLPGEESTRRRRLFVEKLERILHTEWPGNDFTVHVFGSSGNDLYTSESDVDICIETPMKRLEEMHMLAEALDKHGMQNVVCIPQAKVRIVKVWDPVLQLASDMNVNNTLALENTRMIKTYVQIDERVRPLAMIVKYWTKQRSLNDAGIGGTISSYTWICMILNFLQTRDPPIIPTLHKLPLSYRKKDEATGKPRSEFADDLDKLKGFGRDNRESLGQLLFHFFRSYGYEVDYEKKVVSVREGKLITRKEKNWHREGLQKEGGNRLCVEEPFNTERNLGNSADDYAWHDLHLEIRRAFDLLADGGQLDKACEKFEFPPEEKIVFKRPTTTVKPVLQAPNARGRTSIGIRGGRGGFGQKTTYGSQRRSSSSSFGANRPPFLGNPLTPIPGQEFGTSPRGLNEHLHDQLYNQYISLEMQSNSLRAQLHAQQRAQQEQQARAAQLHAQALAQAQAQAQSLRGQNGANGSAPKSPYIGGSASPLGDIPIQPNLLHQQYMYQYPTFDQGHHALQAPQDSPRTDPSSPLPTNATFRRSDHRLSNASETGSRSQSQPARSVGQQTMAQPILVPGYPMQQYFDPANSTGYPIARSTPELPATLSASETPYSPSLSSFVEGPASSEQSTPRGYVGYFLAEQPLAQYTVPQIPSYSELHQRRRRVSPEVTQPLLSTALRRVSRSPSPLRGHSRNYTTDATSAGLAEAEFKDRPDSARPADHCGPVIVNGSFPLPLQKAADPNEAIEAFPSLEPHHSVPFEGYYSQSTGDSYGLTSTHHQYAHEPPSTQAQMHVEGSSKTDELPRKEESPVGLNGVSQPFSPPSDEWRSPPTANGHYAELPPDPSPTTAQSVQRQPASYGAALKSVDTKNSPRVPPQEIKSAGLGPLLSPVLETRTPSPTASRQQGTQKAVNGTGSSQTKENHHHNRTGSHTPKNASRKENAKEGSRVNHQKGHAQNNERTSKPSQLSTNNAGTWQPSSSKRSKKRKSKQGGEQKSTGEPMPANASERKGG